MLSGGVSESELAEPNGNVAEVKLLKKLPNAFGASTFMGTCVMPFVP
jgi:hypothetical protein